MQKRRRKSEVSEVPTHCPFTTASLTHIVTEQREREWQKQVEERRRRRTERGDRDAEHDEDYDDAPRGPLAIEAPPSSQPVDLRQLAAQNNSAGAPPPQQAPYNSQIPPYQQQYQQQPQQGYPPQFPWNSGGGSSGPTPRNSGEAVANTAPSQPVPQQAPQQQQQLQQEFDASAYSQNV